MVQTSVLDSFITFIGGISTDTVVVHYTSEQDSVRNLQTVLKDAFKIKYSTTFKHKCDNTVLRRIVRSKRDEVTGEWRRLDNEKLYALY